MLLGKWEFIKDVERECGWKTYLFAHRLGPFCKLALVNYWHVAKKISDDTEDQNNIKTSREKEDAMVGVG